MCGTGLVDSDPVDETSPSPTADGPAATLPDGHRHEVRWSPTDLEAQLLLVQDAARTAGRTPVAQDWSISSYAVRESAVSDLEPVLALLTEAGHLPG